MRWALPMYSTHSQYPVPVLVRYMVTIPESSRDLWIANHFEEILDRNHLRKECRAQTGYNLFAFPLEVTHQVIDSKPPDGFSPICRWLLSQFTFGMKSEANQLEKATIHKLLYGFLQNGLLSIYPCYSQVL